MLRIATALLVATSSALALRVANELSAANALSTQGAAAADSGVKQCFMPYLCFLDCLRSGGDYYDCKRKHPF